MPPKPKNVHAPAIRVSHSQLARWGDESDFKSKCPACEKGLLLVMRDQTTFQLINVDRCVSCGQLVIYTDKFIGGEPVYDVHKDKN